MCTDNGVLVGPKEQVKQTWMCQVSKIIPTMQQRRTDKHTFKSTWSTGTHLVAHQLSGLPNIQNSEQYSKNDTRYLPPILQHMLTSQKPNWQQHQQWRQQQGHRNRSEEHQIPCETMCGTLGGMEANGMIGQRGTKTNGAIRSRTFLMIKIRRTGHQRWQL